MGAEGRGWSGLWECQPPGKIECILHSRTTGEHGSSQGQGIRKGWREREEASEGCGRWQRGQSCHSQWAHLPHSSHAPVEVKKPENLSKMCSVFSKRESTSGKNKADFLHGKEVSSGDKAGYFS